MPRPGRPDSRWGYLANAFVLAEHRNRGVGAALLTELVAGARDRGCARIVLAPSERSVPFYRAAGFGPASMLLAQTLDPPPR
jgi:GNAT superfamily N-acetyltransferase